ncbi:MAG: hypothetical protein ACLP9S_00280 [Syntrophales bacterium]
MDRNPSIRGLFLSFLRLGITSFGGPAIVAHKARSEGPVAGLLFSFFICVLSLGSAFEAGPGIFISQAYVFSWMASMWMLVYRGINMFDRISRRDMFTKKIVKLLFDLASTKTLYEEELKRESLEHYFKSPIHSYPLLHEMPWHLLVAEAKIHGIPVEGRDKNAIARDLFLIGNNSAT